MGYTTNFNGEFTISPPLTKEHEAYLQAFASVRHVKRDVRVIEKDPRGFPDPVREAVGLPLGSDAEYFVGGKGFAGQYKDASVVNESAPPNSLGYEGAKGEQPGLWCQWVPTSSTTLAWDEGEKFYNYVEWLVYLVERFFIPWGYVLNGEVEWDGEERGDIGLITIENNVVSVAVGSIGYDGKTYAGGAVVK